MINFDPSSSSILPNAASPTPNSEQAAGTKSGFSDAVKAMCRHVSRVDDLQQASDASIQDLLTGKNNDLTAVVAAVAEADMSFKVLVGVRNKLIEAYKQTVNMPL